MNSIGTKYQLLIIIFLGLTTRLVLSLLPGFKYDMDAWFSWALRLQNFDFAHFYTPAVWTNYTPGFLYLLSLIGFLKATLNLSDSVIYYIIKLPTIIAEIILGLFIYKELAAHHQKRALIAISLILLNLGLIFNSSIWGQIDGLLTLFMTLSIYYLYKNKLSTSGVFLALSVLIKPQALALLPVFAIFFLFHFSLIRVSKTVLIGLLTLIIGAIPFFANNPFWGIFDLISRMTGDYPYNSLNAYNLWGVLGFWVSDSQKFFNLTYQVWGILLYTGFWILVLYRYSKNRIGLYTLAALATLSFFFLPTRAHERYLYPAIPFLILSLRENWSRFKIVLIIVLSILYSLNLYYVYIYYNQIYMKIPQIIYWQSVYQFIDINKQFISFISMIVFLTLAYLLLFHKKVDIEDG